MKMKFYSLFGLLFCTASSLLAQNGALTVNVETAGTLPSLVTEAQKYSTTKIKVSGFLNGTDVKFLRDMAGVNDQNGDTNGILTDIDLTDATVEAGGETYLSYFSTDTWDDVNRTTEDDVFPADFFHGTSVTHVALPSTIKKIDDNAFQNCSQLTSISIPDNVTEIGSNAFSGSGLTAIDVPASVSKMGTYCFWGCANMKKVNFNASVTAIPEGTFSQADMTEITLPSTVTEIGTAAFQFCYSLKKIGGMDNVVKIKDYAFNQCKSLESIKLPTTLQSMGTQCLSNCDVLPTITIPAAVTYIGKSAFINDTTLTSIIVEEGSGNYSSSEGLLYNNDGTELVCCPAGKEGAANLLATTEKISESAFDHCIFLNSVALPASLKEVGNDAFNFASSLSLIKCEAVEPPTVGWRGAFFRVPTETCELQVPTGSKDKYATASGWKDFKNITEKGTSSISTTQKGLSAGEEYYNMEGYRMDSLRKGLNIIRAKNGETRKVFVR